jgi:hypothetical protein
MDHLVKWTSGSSGSSGVSGSSGSVVLMDHHLDQVDLQVVLDHLDQVVVLEQVDLQV